MNVFANYTPMSAPDLFAIETTSTTATLYFTPIIEPISHYTISYGTNNKADQYAVTYSPPYNNGVLIYVVGELKPNTTYYFKIRGENNALPGPWSQTMSAKTKPRSSPTPTPTPTATPSPTLAPTTEPTSTLTPTETITVIATPTIQTTVACEPYTIDGQTFPTYVDPSLPKMPNTDGTIFAAIPDGYGGAYIGGSFTRVSGTVKYSLGHVASDGKLDKAWGSPVTGSVYTLAISDDGSILYIGGEFTKVGEFSRLNLAAVNTYDGSVNIFQSDVSYPITAMTFIAPNLYIAPCLVEEIPTSPTPSEAPTLTPTDTPILTPTETIALTPTEIPTPSATPSEAPTLTPTDTPILTPTETIALTPTEIPTPTPSPTDVPASGIGGIIDYFASLIFPSPTPTVEITPSPASEDGSVATDEQQESSGTSGTSEESSQEYTVLVVDTETGVLSLGPATNGPVRTLGASDDQETLYLGGDFTQVEGENRNNIAAISDLEGWQVDKWNPQVNGSVLAMVMNFVSGTVYAAGDFTTINRVIRFGIGEIRLSDGSVTDWYPICPWYLILIIQFILTVLSLYLINRRNQQRRIWWLFPASLISIAVVVDKVILHRFFIPSPFCNLMLIWSSLVALILGSIYFGYMNRHRKES